LATECLEHQSSIRPEIASNTPEFSLRSEFENRVPFGFLNIPSIFAHGLPKNIRWLYL